MTETNRQYRIMLQFYFTLLTIIIIIIIFENKKNHNTYKANQ